MTKPDYIAGMTWGFMGVRETWANDEAKHSMEQMATATGANWTAIAFSAIQATAHSTEIPYWDAPTVTDEEVKWAIREAKTLGLNVCLKPIVNCADGTWRAHINFFDKMFLASPNGRTGSALTAPTSFTSPRLPRIRAAKCYASAAKWCKRIAGRPNGGS